MCSTTFTPTTPTNAKNSAPCEKEGSAVVPNAPIGATAEEEEETQDTGKTAARATGGATNLARIAVEICLARGTGGISLVRIARRATQASLHCRLSQGETRTAIKMNGLGASRSHAQSPASWAELKPQPPNASSSSLPAR